MEKARLLGEAASLPGINPPDTLRRVIEQIKKVDPKNETGYTRKLITPYDLSNEIFSIETSKDAGKGWQATLAQAEVFLERPCVLQRTKASSLRYQYRHIAPPRGGQSR